MHGYQNMPRTTENTAVARMFEIFENIYQAQNRIFPKRNFFSRIFETIDFVRTVSYDFEKWFSLWSSGMISTALHALSSGFAITPTKCLNASPGALHLQFHQNCSGINALIMTLGLSFSSRACFARSHHGSLGHCLIKWCDMKTNNLGSTQTVHWRTYWGSESFLNLGASIPLICFLLCIIDLTSTTMTLWEDMDPHSKRIVVNLNFIVIFWPAELESWPRICRRLAVFEAYARKSGF